MQVTRDVILDLIPLCHAGEASDDTRDLVAAYAGKDPEIARLLTEPPKIALPSVSQPLTQETEVQTLEKTRKTLKWRSILLISALLFTVLTALAGGFVFYLFGPGGAQTLLTILLTWGPILAILTVVMTFVCWVSYLVYRYYLSA